MNNNEKQYSQRSSSIVNQKRKSFQKSIRREQLQAYFSQKRQELTKNFFDGGNLFQPPPSIEILEKRNQYVKDMCVFFRNQPMVSWKEKISELIATIGYFKGDFTSWIEYNLAPLLADVFKQHIGLTEIQVAVAKLFSAQICHSDPKGSISNAYINDSLIVDNVFILLKTNSYLCHEKICFVTLLAQIASLSNNIRDRIVQIGIGQILGDFADQLLTNQTREDQLILLFLGCCDNFCKVFVRNNLFYFANVHFAGEVIAVLVKIISKRINTSILENSLQCLYKILRSKEDSLFRKMIQEKPDIFQNFVYFLKNGQIRTKEIVLNLYRLIGLFYSKHIWNYVCPADIFDCIMAQIERASTTRSFIVTALKVIEMVLHNKTTVIGLLQHSLGKIVIELLKSQQNDIRKAAYGVVVQVSGYLAKSPNQLSQFIKQYNLLPLIITEISDLTFKSSCILHVLAIIERYIQDNADQGNDFNQVIYNLQTHYNLMNVLETWVYINREGPQFDKIREKASKLVDVMVNHYSNDYM